MLTLIVGGARSGKSRYAEALARTLGGDSVTYLATLEAEDDEMHRRVARHRAQRPTVWRTVEPGSTSAEWAIRDSDSRVVLVDCLSGLVSTALMTHQARGEEAAVAAALATVDALLAACRHVSAEVLVVSNEVGSGLVPATPLGRWFRDALGIANQRVAAAANAVVLVTVGIATPLKGTPPEAAA
jgi:adenosyl cobinamide kinase/adenosyl cobinamide phosphate guanylyltransferase